MSNQSSCIRNAFFSITCIALFAISIFANSNPAEALGCQTALESSTGAVALSNAGTTTKSKGVDEWSGEVVKVTTYLPGVLVIEGAGDGAQSSVYTEGSSSSHPLVDSARLGTGLRELRAVVPAGTHCIQVTPSAATGNFEVAAVFTDACHLGDTDDHGDSFLCATPLTVGGGAASGEVDSSSTADDYDTFTFEQEAAVTVTVTSTAGPVEASLYDGEGALVDTGLIFQIPALAAGRYYVQVSGDDESTYTIGVALDPAP